MAFGNGGFFRNFLGSLNSAFGQPMQNFFQNQNQTSFGGHNPLQLYGMGRPRIPQMFQQQQPFDQQAVLTDFQNRGVDPFAPNAIQQMQTINRLGDMRNTQIDPANRAYGMNKRQSYGQAKRQGFFPPVPPTPIASPMRMSKPGGRY